MPALSHRPNTVSIFAGDPATRGKVLAFILQDVAIPVPGRVRLDLTHSIQAGMRTTPARSPVERPVVDNILIEPEPLTVTGSLSANPLGLISFGLGGFGSAVRRDLIELEKLRRIIALREPLIVVTPVRVYNSMACTSLAETHNGTHKVDLAISFEPVTIVSPLSVSGFLDFSQLSFGAGSTNMGGGQPTSVVPEPAGVAGGLGG